MAPPRARQPRRRPLLRAAAWCCLAALRAADAQEPDTGGSWSCALGSFCTVVVPGSNLPKDGARYEALIILDEGRPLPCLSGFTVAVFRGLTNPRNCEDDNNDNTFRMGTAQGGSTAASYILCWTNPASTLDSRGGAPVADYAYNVGSFTMNGPDPQDIVCTMGDACSVTIGGSGLASTNAVFVIKGIDEFVCENLQEVDVSSLGSSFDNPTVVADSSPYGSYSLGLAGAIKPDGQAVLTGGVYRLCWGAAPSLTPPLYSVNEYKVDVGRFTLHGPIAKDVRCQFTELCETTLTGSGLDSITAHVLVIGASESCGAASPTLADIGGGTWINPGNGMVDALAPGKTSWGIATVGTSNDAYKACWGSLPVAFADYTVELGTFSMAGPVTAARTECTKGIQCEVFLSGVRLIGDNRLMILNNGETCGDAAPSQAAFSPMASTDLRPEADNMEYQLGLIQTGTAREGYVLCWGAFPDGNLAEYSFLIGAFAVAGANYNDMDCTLGVSCVLTLQGHLLASTNKIIIFDRNEGKQCGQNAPILATSFVNLEYQQAVEGASPHGTYLMGTGTNAPIASTYKVCWAHDPASEGGGTNLYRTPVGLFRLHGPNQVAQHCTLSMMCSVTLSGSELATTNGVLVVQDVDGGPSSCQKSTPVVAVFDGIANPRQAEVADAATYHLGIGGSTPAAVGPGTDYRICWGHSPSANTDYVVSLGTFTMHGPEVVGVELCTMGVACTVELGENSVGLAATNQIIVTALGDDCGQASLNVAVFTAMINPTPVNGNPFRDYDLGTFTFGVPGDYAVCWAHDPGAPAVHSSFTVRVATLRVGGPTPRASDCIFSEVCQVELGGLRMEAANEVLIIKDSGTCDNFVDGDVAGWPGITNPVGSALLTPVPGGAPIWTDGDTYRFGMAVSGQPSVGYWLCWAFEPTGVMADFRVTVGRFTMNGPTQGMNIFCTLGEPCNLKITGLGLANTNRVQIVAVPTDPAVEPCGTSRIPSVLRGVEGAKLVTDDANDDTYPMGIIADGGSYAACRVAAPAAYCIGGHYKLCWAHGVNRPTPDTYNVVVQFGSFMVSGPYATYTVDCMLGSVCAFKIYGEGLLSTNRIAIIEGHGRCGDVSPPLAQLGGLKNPHRGSEVETQVDGRKAIIFRLGRSTGGITGSYRICWGHNPGMMSQYRVEVGPFYFREPVRGCSTGDGLSMTCNAL